jgi:hypothetical protein
MVIVPLYHNRNQSYWTRMKQLCEPDISINL